MNKTGRTPREISIDRTGSSPNADWGEINERAGVLAANRAWHTVLRNDELTLLRLLTREHERESCKLTEHDAEEKGLLKAVARMREYGYVAKHKPDAVLSLTPRGASIGYRNAVDEVRNMNVLTDRK